MKASAGEVYTVYNQYLKRYTACLLYTSKTEHFTASANDAFATIRITAKDCTEECLSLIHI